MESVINLRGLGQKIKFWVKYKIIIQVMEGMTSEIENICFVFGSKNESFGKENNFFSGNNLGMGQ